MEKKHEIKVLEMIAKDTKEDTKNFDGRPFNGKTVATYFGHQGAAIAKLADIVKSILEEKKEEELKDIVLPLNYAKEEGEKDGETDN